MTGQGHKGLTLFGSRRRASACSTTRKHSTAGCSADRERARPSWPSPGNRWWGYGTRWASGHWAVLAHLPLSAQQYPNRSEHVNEPCSGRSAARMQPPPQDAGQPASIVQPTYGGPCHYWL